jgi:hypothetical protein
VSLVDQLLTTTWEHEFRSRPTDFTRAGPLTPELLVTMLLFMAGDAGRRGYGHLLDDFWDEAQRAGIKLPSPEPVSAAAFCKARRKLKPELLSALLTKVADAIVDKHEPRLRCHGRRILAVDGMRHNLQRSAELAEHFGVPHGGHCPQMLVSTLFDVVGKFPCAATIAPGSSCERQELLKLTAHLREGDVLVLDRGYPSFEVFSALDAIGVDVVVRMPKSGFEAVEVFRQSEGTDYQVLVHPSPEAARAGATSLQMRAVRIDAGGEEPWLLFTALRRSEVTRSQLGQLYHLRWEIEEFFKLIKSDYFSLRQLHSKAILGIEQEFRAQLLLTAIARLLMANAAATTDVPYDDLATKSGILSVATSIVRLLLCDDPEIQHAQHASLLARIARRPNRRRPNRSYPRRSFKPGPRWNSKGKVGG